MPPKIKLSLIKRSIFFFLKIMWGICKFLSIIFMMLLPTIIFIVLLTKGVIEIPGPILVPKLAHNNNVHELIPHTRWEHLKPCGAIFDEEKEFKKALQCVNKKVWPSTPLPSDRESLSIPRCFIISTASPDIFSGTYSQLFNFIPVMTPFGPGAVLGVYQPETKTVFIVENVDSAMIYRHELQHFFLHLHDPDAKIGGELAHGGGHFQPIWDECEPPYYSPTKRSELIGSLITDDDRIVIKNNERIK